MKMRTVKTLIIALLLTLMAGKAHSTILVFKGESTLFSNTLYSSFLARTNEQVFVHNMESKLNYKAIKERDPSLIITIGNVPVAELAQNVKGVDIVSVGHNDFRILAQLDKVIAIPMEMPADQAMLLTRALFPKRKTIGVLYNPKNSAYVLNDLRAQMQKNGFKLGAIKVDTPEDVYLSINTFKGKIDLYMFIQDATILKSKSLSTIYSFLIENKIPYICPSQYFMKTNGVMALSADPVELGRFVYRIVEMLTKEGKKKEDIDLSLSKVKITFSMQNAGAFGIGADDAYDFFKFAAGKGFRVEVIE